MFCPLMVHTFASVIILQVNGECWANMIVVTKASEVLVTKLEESQIGLVVTHTISKKKNNSNNKRKHRVVEFLLKYM